MLKLLWIILLLSCISCFAQESLPGSYTVSFFDSVRNRKLVTDIWGMPVNGHEIKPLILFSHGTGGNRRSLSWLCEGFASNGFIVAAVDHYGNTFDNPIPKEFVTFWKRPLDISFVLTQILSDKTLSKYIDRKNIFCAGFSIGGYTTLALAGGRLDLNAILKFIETPQGFREVNVPEMPGMIDLFKDEEVIRSFKTTPGLKDKRIRAALAIAPAAGQGFISTSQMSAIDIPVFIIGTNADSIAPVRTNAAHYKELIPTSKWWLIEGNAGHYVFLNEGDEELKRLAPLFFKDPEGVNRKQIHQQVVEIATAFFISNLTR